MDDFSKNYFELFGLETGFLLDQGRLSESYRELQKVVHPDRFANATDQERRIALQHATRVNEGFQTLRQPLSRAIYLLSLQGIDIHSDQDTSMDPTFLMEQIELREGLSEIMDVDEPLVKLDGIMRHLADLKGDLMSQLEQQFSSSGETDLILARDSVRKFQFLDKLQSEAETVEARLEDAF